jgi:very-short-patch-repair endonuclease
MLNKKILKYRARTLRKNMTDAEEMLWKYLRKKQINNLQFYRQRPLGKYVVDFYCPNKKIVIEVDGSQHYQGKGLEYDNNRTDFLVKVRKLKVLRFNNIEVLILSTF